MRKVLALVAMIAVAAPVGHPSPAAGSDVACDGSFHTYQKLPPAEIVDATTLASGDLWALGNDQHEETSENHGYTVRFDGETWHREEMPMFADGDVFVNAIDGTSPSDIWVAGLVIQRGSRFRSVMLHYDGSTWKRVPLPDPPAEDSLADVLVVAPDDVWAVGYRFPDFGVRPLVMHFDGDAWSIEETPRPRGDSALAAVGARDGSGPMAVGTSSHGEVEDRAFGVRRTDQEWALLRFTRQVRRRPLNLLHLDVEFRGARWIVGRDRSSRDGGLALLHNGERWTLTDVPNARGSEQLFHVDAHSDGEAWAVGWRFVPERAYPFAVRWDGTQWERVPVRDPGTWGELSAVIADEPGGAWAFISYGSDRGPSGTAILRACGAT